MKKLVVLLTSVLCVSLAVGCGGKSKVLECTKTEKQTGAKLSQKIKATFKGNEVTDMTIDMDAILDDSYKSYKSTFKSVFDSQFKKYKNLKGVDVKISETDDGVNIKLTADLTKMDKDAKDELDIVDTKANYAKSKKELEADGYNCK